MDTPQHCLDQSAECRRLMKAAHSEAEVYSLELLARTWATLAGQIDRYIKILREKRGFVRAFRGYAGWEAGQLEGELGQNAWLIREADAEFMGGEPDQSLWLRFMKGQGPVYYLLALAYDVYFRTFLL